MPQTITPDLRNRARGVLLGQLVGDALGTTVEFKDPHTIQKLFPNKHREIIGQGPFNLLPGQVTDDSELALALARCLVQHGFDTDARARAYAAWIASGPFDCGMATSAAFGGHSADVTAQEMLARSQERNGAPSKQANGALMRISPLGIFGAFLDPAVLQQRGAEDARFSHPSPVCQGANQVYLRAMQALLHGATPPEAYALAQEAAQALDEPALARALADVSEQPLAFGEGQGWVMVALRNAFFQLLHAKSFEDAMVSTVMAGGDTDTNACIAGALLGASHGLSGIPPRWIVAVLACRTDRGAMYQTTDALVLADQLLERGLAAR